MAWLIEAVRMWQSLGNRPLSTEIGSRYRTIHYTEMSFTDILSKDIATDRIINRYFKFMTGLATSHHYEGMKGLVDGSGRLMVCSAKGLFVFDRCSRSLTSISSWRGLWGSCSVGIQGEKPDEEEAAHSDKYCWECYQWWTHHVHYTYRSLFFLFFIIKLSTTMSQGQASLYGFVCLQRKLIQHNCSHVICLIYNSWLHESQQNARCSVYTRQVFIRLWLVVHIFIYHTWISLYVACHIRLGFLQGA